jgi:ABC-type uncharacterized transport system fused permease/ATPase subunit
MFFFSITANKSSLKPGDGKVIEQDHLIRFEDVPLVTPNGDVLVEKLNFEVGVFQYFMKIFLLLSLFLSTLG